MGEALAGWWRRNVGGGGSAPARVLLTLGVALFIVWRQPELFTAPRFWAEEGTNFFTYAHTHTWWENLFHAQFGYYTLYNSLATSLAAAVPLEHAPLVTTGLAAAVQLGVSAAVLWWTLPLLPSLWQRAVVAFGIQFLAHPRIWLTTIGVQYFLCVLSFLVLLEERDPGQTPPLSRQLIITGTGLTGVLSCFLLPAFFLRWRRDRSRGDLRYILILTACLALQSTVFLAALAGKGGDVDFRLRATDPLRLATHFIHFQFVVPFTGRVIWLGDTVGQFEDRVAGLFRPLLGSTPATHDYLVLQQLSGVAIVLFLAAGTWALRRQRDTGVIVTSFVVVAALSTLLSVNASGGPRYTYAPSVMILVLVVAMAGHTGTPALFRRAAAGMLLAAILLCDYRATMVFAYSPDWPQWRQELQRWRSDPAYQMKIWPAPFQMTLPSPAGSKQAGERGGTPCLSTIPG